VTVPQIVLTVLVGLAWLFMSFWAEPLFPLGSPAWLGMTIGVVLLAALIFFWRKVQRLALKMSVLVGLFVFIGVGAILGGGIWLLVRFTPSVVGGAAQTESSTRPEVTLRFIYPKGPALELINQSDVLAREIKWTVVLWNIDTLSERTDPLPIPVQTFDWIRPNQKSGPNGLFTAPTVKALLTSGNRLFGSTSVICPDCVRGWTYMVYIKWRDGGWYSKVMNEVSGDLIVPKKFTAEDVLAFFEDSINNIPEKDRIPITDR